MDVVISNTPSSFHHFGAFTHGISRIFVSIDNEVHNEKYKDVVTVSNVVKAISEIFNYSYDGQVYWFPKHLEEKLVNELTDWMNEESNHPEDFVEDNGGVLNCLLFKDGREGFCIIDPQVDAGSTFENFIKPFIEKNPDDSIFCISDYFLPEHILLGRKTNENEFENFYFLYKEDILTDSFFLRGIESFGEDGEYAGALDNSKTIVLTGTFAIAVENIISLLRASGFRASEKITGEYNWLWCGAKPGTAKLDDAADLNIKISAIDEVIDEVFNKYVELKAQKNT